METVKKVAVLYATDDNVNQKAFKYPAGEWQVRLHEKTVNEIVDASLVRIIADIKSSDDIMKLLLLHDAVLKHNHSIKVYMPYLPYSRADRRFVPGDCAGLQVFSKLIEHMDVSTLDMHNPNVIVPNLKNISAAPFILKAIESFKLNCEIYTKYSSVNVLFPDKGAHDRYSEDIPEYLGNNHEKITINKFYCLKQRNPVTGEFSGFDVPVDKISHEYPTIIIDDLCDGGGTFNGIADILMKENPYILGLYVTHGIFSKGLSELLKRFYRIYTTNSYWQHVFQEDSEIVSFNCYPELFKKS